jgi:hypothetical protein
MAVTELIESVDGQLESFYCALGQNDAYVLADLPITSLPPPLRWQHAQEEGLRLEPCSS